jgi:hypothetical protein
LRHRRHVPHSPSTPIDVDNQVQTLAQEGPRRSHAAQIQQRSPSPPGPNDVEDQVPDDPTVEAHSPSQSPSPQAGSKRRHHTDEEVNVMNSDSDADVHISKAPKKNKKTARPKAGDYDELGKEQVLAAANTYRALLASQGAFPNTSMELKLVKKSWKMVNAENGVASLALTPSIVTIVSKFIYLIISYSDW